MPDPAKPGFLRRLRVKRVSLVDVGANLDSVTGDGAHIMLFKRADMKKNSPGVDSVHVDTTDERDDYEKAILSAEDRNKLPDSAFAAVWTDAQGKKQRKLPYRTASGAVDHGHLAAALGRLGKTPMPENVKAEARRKLEAASRHKEKNVKKSTLRKFLGLFSEKDEAKRAAGAEEIAKALEADDHDENDNDDDDKQKSMHKADDPMCKCADCMAKRDAAMTDREKAAMAKAASAEARAEAAETLAKSAAATVQKMRDEQDLRDMREVLKEFKATAFKMENDEDPKKYLALKRASPEAYASTMEILKAQDTMLAESNLFKNLGSSRRGGSPDAWSQIEAKADAIFEKAGNTLTREQVIEKVLLANPKLARQSRQEAH